MESMDICSYTHHTKRNETMGGEERRGEEMKNDGICGCRIL